DVNNLRYAVLDHDQSTLSQGYQLGISGSRYFIEQAPLADYEDIDRRMRSGELALAIEIPPGFGRNMLAGRPTAIGAWFDGPMPRRAAIGQGRPAASRQHGRGDQARPRTGAAPAVLASVEGRFRYTPDVASLPATVPAVIPLLLLMLPAMLAARSV